MRKHGHKVKIITYTTEKKIEVNEDVIRIFDVSRRNKNYKKILWICVRVFQYIYEKLTRNYIPKEYLWLYLSKIYVPRLLVNYDVDIVIATYPPLTALELGRFLSDLWGKPLLTDFRDGMLFESIEGKKMKKEYIYRYFEKYEKKIVDSSDLITTMANPVTNYFKKKYSKESIYTIFNGYDPEDFEIISEKIPFDKKKINIVYAGRIGLSIIENQESFEGFLHSLEYSLDKNKTLREKLAFYFIGEYSKREIEMINKFKYKNIIKLYSMMERSKVLNFQKKADVLLLITALGKKSAIPGKLFEYLYVKKKILLIGDECVASTIIENSGIGVRISPYDRIGVMKYLSNICMRKGNVYNVNEKYIEKFSREKQVEFLEILLNKIYLK